MTTTTAVDTGKVTDRRAIRFNSPADLRADISRIAAAERAGKLRRTGNWTSGQTFGHLGSWIDFAYDGYPPDLRPPWFVKLVLKMMKGRFMRGPLPAGKRIPGIEGGTKACDPCSLDDGLQRLTRAWDRLEKGPPSRPNIIFGALSHEDWVRLHLRHAELHLSFLHP